MKTLFTICICTIILGCSGKNNSDKTPKNVDQIDNDSILKNEISKTTNIDKSINSVVYLTSTYDNPAFPEILKSQKEALKRLSERKVFDVIASKVMETLIRKHHAYFTTKLDYELLAATTGDLFQEDKDDAAFIVYDKMNKRISFLIYNEMKNKYFELFREIKVENGLENANCSYSVFGTLDYQLAAELVNQEEYLLKNPESYLESSPFKIVDISKDDDFVLKSGCFSNKVSKDKLSNSLCIATSAVYNNWECLKYDKATNTLLIFYGQAFAD
ncbi:hypothetical protein [Flavobacterium algicola]|uniref:hypothetical protein n=1 Tax=Flavobacterium algicola TaxID=556529 RepID=UPI001EFC6EF9|nr:hypothetical protein [Flavobacterium algicola]MCG9792997.1 hypothetical protein [Flavobacterium algicola]